MISLLSQTGAAGRWVNDVTTLPCNEVRGNLGKAALNTEGTAMPALDVRAPSSQAKDKGRKLQKQSLAAVH